ncbi:hypothetical protein H9P43_009496 [Blastocladiella emersonii ATCC 22665]|nr:hypothetical protein H9P43_009496 [Blastocladiella emersonii ATCC 22665]
MNLPSTSRLALGDPAARATMDPDLADVPPPALPPAPTATAGVGTGTTTPKRGAPPRSPPPVAAAPPRLTRLPATAQVAFLRSPHADAAPPPPIAPLPARRPGFVERTNTIRGALEPSLRTTSRRIPVVSATPTPTPPQTAGGQDGGGSRPVSRRPPTTATSRPLTRTGSSSASVLNLAATTMQPRPDGAGWWHPTDDPNAFDAVMATDTLRDVPTSTNTTAGPMARYYAVLRSGAGPKPHTGSTVRLAALVARGAGGRRRSSSVGDRLQDVSAAADFGSPPRPIAVTGQSGPNVFPSMGSLADGLNDASPRRPRHRSSQGSLSNFAVLAGIANDAPAPRSSTRRELGSGIISTEALDALGGELAELAATGRGGGGGGAPGRHSRQRIATIDDDPEPAEDPEPRPRRTPRRASFRPDTEDDDDGPVPDFVVALAPVSRDGDFLTARRTSRSRSRPASRIGMRPPSSSPVRPPSTSLARQPAASDDDGRSFGQAFNLALQTARFAMARNEHQMQQQPPPPTLELDARSTRPEDSDAVPGLPASRPRTALGYGTDQPSSPTSRAPSALPGRRPSSVTIPSSSRGLAPATALLDHIQATLMVNQHHVALAPPHVDAATGVRKRADPPKQPIHGVHKFALVLTHNEAGSPVALQQQQVQQPETMAAPSLHVRRAVLPPPAPTNSNGPMRAESGGRFRTATVPLPGAVAVPPPVAHRPPTAPSAGRRRSVSVPAPVPTLAQPPRPVSPAPAPPPPKPILRRPGPPVVPPPIAIPRPVERVEPPPPEPVPDPTPAEPAPEEPAPDPMAAVLDALVEQFCPRLMSMDHTQRYTFVMDYARLMKRHEDYTTKALVNNNLSTLDVDTRKIDEISDEQLMTMSWNMYFFIHSMGREFLLPLSTRQYVTRLVLSEEDPAVKVQSLRRVFTDLPKEQYLNYKAVLGHAFRLLHASTSATLAHPMVVIFGSILFPTLTSTSELMPAKPKSFLDAIRRGTFRSLSSTSLDDDDDDDEDDGDGEGGIREPRPLGNTSRRGSVTSQLALRTLNPADADEGSIFAASMCADDVAGMMEEITALRAQIARVLGSILRGDAAADALPPEARVMAFLVEQYEGLYDTS